MVDHDAGGTRLGRGWADVDMAELLFCGRIDTGNRIVEIEAVFDDGRVDCKAGRGHAVQRVVVHQDRGLDDFIGPVLRQAVVVGQDKATAQKRSGAG